jgi:hypothetical protein
VNNAHNHAVTAVFIVESSYFFSMDNETTTVDNTCNFGVNARALYDEIQVLDVVIVEFNSYELFLNGKVQCVGVPLI